MSTSIVTILVSIGMLAYSLYRTFELVKLRKKKSASENWPIHIAEIYEKKVTKHHSTKGRTSYYPEITYRYIVMGQEYEKTLRLSGIYSRISAEAKLDQLGSAIELKYDPNNPKEHITVQEKVTAWDYLVIIFLLAFSLFMLIPMILEYVNNSISFG